MSIFNIKETAFGLDISDRDLRLIQLKRRGRHIKVQNYNEIRLPAGCLTNGEIINPKIFGEYLQKLIKSKYGRGQLSSRVIACLPEAKTYLEAISIEAVAPDELSEKIAASIPMYFPLKAEEVNFDWQIVGKNQDKLSVLVGVSPKETVSGYLHALCQAELIPIAFEVEAAAIAKLLLEHNDQAGSIAVIDLGANRTGLFIYDENMIKMTSSLPLGGSRINNLIADKLNLDVEKAELAKIACGLDRGKCQGAILEIMDGSISELARQIIKSIDHYHEYFLPRNKINRLILCGGGANMENISRILADKTGIRTAISDPFANIHSYNHKYFTPQKSQSFATALGLALMGLEARSIL